VGTIRRRRTRPRTHGRLSVERGHRAACHRQALGPGPRARRLKRRAALKGIGLPIDREFETPILNVPPA